MHTTQNQSRHPPATHSQRGVAIITALLIVAIATAISVRISTRIQLDIRRTANMITLDQSRLYTLAAEDWSRRILKQDKHNSQIDTLNENWAIALPPLPVEGGSIQGALTDLSACLNLNTLINHNTGEINKTSKSRFEQLYHNAGLEHPPTQAIADWMDANQLTRTPDGAEDGYYLNLPKPYRSANTPLQSITELRLIKGFEKPEILSALQSAVCAYPANAQANNINVNTASKEVLKSLSANLSADLVEKIIEQRSKQPFKTLGDFLNFNQLKTIIKNTDGLSVSSDIFLLRTQATIGQANLVVYSILRRDSSGNTVVLARSQRTL